ncbi:MAG: NADH-quinone oxidoreductase subunit C [Sphingomonadaceae bacterium]|nr:NADH-quinone oxidoreductase subunit C [Sphingomonadaceae bacterium]
MSFPRVASAAGLIEPARSWPGVLHAVEAVGETALSVERGALVAVLKRLRDEHQFQQLMCISGVDYPERAERFEVVYDLLSLTANSRIRVKCTTDEDEAVPSVVDLWPVAGWFEREIWDLYGVIFDGNPDLRRIVTDYGFQGHPLRKDFPLTGYVEMRYSEKHKRVVYEPVTLPQDFRSFDFLSPWEGARYVLPGDEKATAAAPGAPSPAPPPVLAEPPTASGFVRSRGQQGFEQAGGAKPGPADGKA